MRKIKKRGNLIKGFMKRDLFKIFIVISLIIITIFLTKNIRANSAYTNTNGDIIIDAAPYYNATISNSTGLVSFYDSASHYLTDFGGVEIINDTNFIENTIGINATSVSLNNYGNISYVSVTINGTYANYITNYTFNLSSGKVLVNQTIIYKKDFSTSIERIFSYTSSNVYENNFEGDLVYHDNLLPTNTLGDTNNKINKTLIIGLDGKRDFNLTTDKINSVNVSIFMTEVSTSGSFSVFVNDNLVRNEACTNRYAANGNQYKWETWNFSTSFLVNGTNNVYINASGGCWIGFKRDSTQLNHSYNSTGGLFPGEYYVRFLVNPNNDKGGAGWWDVGAGGGGINRTNSYSKFGNYSLKWMSGTSSLPYIRNIKYFNEGFLNLSVPGYCYFNVRFIY